MKKYKNTIVKVVCLLTAFFLWGYVINEVDPTITRTFTNVPVEFKNMSYLRDQNLQLMTGTLDPIEVTVEGHRKALNAISTDDLRAIVDLQGIQGGVQAASIHVGLTSGDGTVKDYAPKSLTLEVEAVVSKPFAVEARTFGNLPDGHILGEIQVNTEEVTLKGPEQIIDSVSVVVANVNIGEKTVTSIVNAPIQALDSDLKPVNNVVIEPGTAEVQVAVYKTKTVPIEVVLDDPNREDLQTNRITVNPSSVIITGDGGNIDGVKSIETQPINTQELVENLGATATLVLPEGTRMVNNQETFIVRYEPQRIVTKNHSLPVDRVLGENGGELEEIPRQMPQRLQLKLTGETGVLESLNNQDLQIMLKGDGTIEVHAPSGVTVESVEPNKIDPGTP
ncbi:MAG: CdaR family protein [Tissierellia bacterium]|nr:CdaR family protein [Tissierellia bacterium]